MPSCVIKTCRNHSGYTKKSQGISFHRIPKGNDAWRDDWIQIIRKCRHENNWCPSKTSVVCNVHFDTKDLYITKCGLLRIVPYAVPKMFLSEPEYILDGTPPQHNSCNLLSQVLFEPEYILDGEPPEIKTMCPLQQNFATLRSIGSSSVQPTISEESGTQNSTSCLLQAVPKTEPVEVENNFVLISPKTEVVEVENNFVLNVPKTEPVEVENDFVLVSPKTEVVEVENDFVVNSPKTELVEFDNNFVLNSLKTEVVEVENNFMLNSSKIEPVEDENNFVSNSSKNETLGVKIDMGQPPPALFNLKERHLKQKIDKMQGLMQLQRKKIKTLNQRVRRLLIRNKSLKAILASLKEEKNESVLQ